MDELTKLTPEEMEHLTKEQVQDVLMAACEAALIASIFHYVIYMKREIRYRFHEEFNGTKDKELAKIERMRR